MNEIVEFKRTEDSTQLTNIESNRAMQEVQAAVLMAKKFPRDQTAAYNRIMTACERQGLCESAMFAFPRGGTMVSGASIRLAEVIAQNWGNMDFGIRELSQENGYSEVEAFAWDIETNTKQTKSFKVPHVRQTKYGKKNLTDPRDIYEMIANQGARRLRACILGIIPADITESAIGKCEETLKKGGGAPLVDRIRSMVQKFSKIGVSQEMIEERLQHKTTAIVENQLIELGKIYNSIKTGISDRTQWFKIEKTPEINKELTEKIKAKSEKKTKPKTAKEETKQAKEETKQDVEEVPFEK